MKTTLPNIKKLAGRGRTNKPAGSEHDQLHDDEHTEAAAEPKPPPPLSLFFMLSHLEEDGPVRLDGVKLAVMEVMGLELDEPKLGAFAGSLNALDFPVQLLVRQHPPMLQGLRSNLAEAQPEDLPQQTRDAADSLGQLLSGLEAREGILDRRFYAICEHGRADELRGLLSRAAWGCSPCRARPCGCCCWPRPWADRPTSATKTPSWRWKSTAARHPRGRSPDPLPAPGQVAPLIGPGFLQGLMAAGAPMDLSVHLGPFPRTRPPAPWSGRRSASSRPSRCP